MDYNEAHDLWSSLRSALQRADDAIKKIIANRAWEPLGYPTFAAAWAGEMKGVRLAAEIRAHVVYAMHAEGLGVDEIDSSLGVGSGIGPSSISKLVEDAELGIPVEKASVVRRHLRKPRGESSTLHVELGHENLERYRALAKKADVILEDVVRTALIEWALSIQAD